MPPTPRCRPRAAFRMLALAVAALTAAAASTTPFPFAAEPLTPAADRSAELVAAARRLIEAAQPVILAERESFWRPDFHARSAYETSLAPNRARLARMAGLADQREAAPEFRVEAAPDEEGPVATTPGFTVLAVRWPVLAGLEGRGLLLRPTGPTRARVVLFPDADQAPEQLAGLLPGLDPVHQAARRLAEAGCEVLVPRLLDRDDTHSGNPALGRLTNQTHREWIYRQSFPLGRHPIGYELQQARAAIDAWARRGDGLPVGVAGWGEGGLLALFSAALETRCSAALVSGYFGPRERLAEEPLYRNLFGYLREFGDAELARLILPRKLVVEAVAGPEIAGPPEPRTGRAGAAPGRLTSAAPAEVRRELARAAERSGPWASHLQLVVPAGVGVAPHGAAALGAFLRQLGGPGLVLVPPGPAPVLRGKLPDRLRLQREVVAAHAAHAQAQIPAAQRTREDFLWRRVQAREPSDWQREMRPFRELFHTQIIGAWPADEAPTRVRARTLAERPAWTVHEVVLERGDAPFAWGHLLLPRGLRPGEKRAVVVAQHGLEGLPSDLWAEDPASRTFATYQAFAARLAERGFIVFAPHNLYRGPEFRQLQRLAHPLGLSLFSLITAQHAAILDWLGTLPVVDAERMGFYGLSYGGATALRVPALLERYAAVVCSGNFNEWVWKLATTDWTGSYVFTREYEMPEFNLGSTFGHAEMAALIAPRPFMVERGHADGVGTDEWVSFEYAKVRRLYARLGLPERTAIEYFDGGHRIHGAGTFRFLHRHLAWPEPR
ncbi:MAG: dienelactone hydrolase family protein [Opitutaceae bacterium]